MPRTPFRKTPGITTSTSEKSTYVFFTKHDSNTIQRQTEPSIVHLADRGARAKRIVALTGIAIEAKN
jgi:hypothetical protein